MQISWPDTKLTQLLKIQLPIIQAPMAGGATTEELIAAVSKWAGQNAYVCKSLPASELIQLINNEMLILTH